MSDQVAPMQQSDCEELVREATEASKHSLDVSAAIFEDAAKCYDQQGDRKKAGQYLILAGDFFLDLDNKEKAALCYGKAIMRYLMIDDIYTAEILLEKGKEYGFSSSTHQYRIALNTLERQKKAKIVEDETEESAKEVEALPDVDILPIEGEEDELVPLDDDFFSLDEDVQPKKQEFMIPQLEKEHSSTFGSYAVLAAVSQATREKTSQEIQTNAFVKNTSGESQLIEPQFKLSPVEPIDSSTDDVVPLTSSHPPESEVIEESVPSEDLKGNDTLDLDYTAKTEITNEFEDELVDIEIINTIPFSFQVVNILTDFELDEKKRTSDGLVFTWKKDRIEPGEKISVEYILRKRVERFIVFRKENRVSVVNIYQSVQQDLQTNLNFVNTSGKVFHEILVEDVIPPELMVNNTTSNKKIKPVTIPTHDSTLYRWIFSTLLPSDNFSVFYEFREKPLTRHYIDEYDCDIGFAKIEKISQPAVDTNQCEYLWFFSLENSISDNITMIDRIPSDYSLILVDPPHLTPSIKKEKTHQILSWQISSDEAKTIVVLRIRGSDSFTPLAPTIDFTCGEQLQLVEKSSTSEKKMVDLRRLKEMLKESI
ncbi:MAG: hypothetical protein JSU57_01225 [Candidatus Heimdallarchaeota archaeon]|nr:MAG: hypothetical protein JSU57_01225 [Candidatus Heimdallarchaeota archaeon]